ncbi:glutamyl-tRNA amidotransferase [Bacillus sp. M6-12]|uniref:GatB/YqeY domain-containing protein n=1 Tax=Bacillus sp. M6-12 TaxID=2054166 RepID=UPI000C761C9A|nr:GatB/YqeY domain-containing protein [Bacillus sp. M6-12]PLS15066.1 glutamyl-tRNA amidotransferase [Bacillus sp. M6-12]
MTLQKRIMEDLKNAMRNKETLKKGVLTLIKAGLTSAEKEKRSELTEAEELAIVQRELKQTKQSLAEAEKANRPDIVEQEKAKIEIIEAYLPKQLSKEEIEKELDTLGVQKGMTMGEAMKIAKPALNGKVDNGLLSQLIKQRLA